MQPVTDVGSDISPDGISTTRQPTSDIDRALAAGKSKATSNDVAIKDLPKVDETDIPPEVIPSDENTDVTLDDFLTAAGKELTAKPEDETKEENKDANKQLEQVTSKDKKTPITKSDDKSVSNKSTADKQVVPPADKTIQRDYSDIDEEHQEMFKRMHNDAYNFLKPIYKEYKILKAENEKTKKDFEDTKKQYDELKSKGPQLPDSYYENPNGYLLNPEFQVAVRDQNDAQIIFNHWNKQYQDVASGAKEIDILNYDNQGNLVITGKVKADAGIEAKLLSYITHAQHNLINKQAQTQTIIQGHQGKTSEAIKSFQAQTAKEYAGLNTPENKPIYEPLIKQEFEAIHPAFRNSPLALPYAQSRVMVAALSQLLKQAANQQNGNNSNNNNAKSGNNSNRNGGDKVVSRNKQPSAAEITGEVNGKKSSEDDSGEDVTYDDFQKIKALD